MGRVNGADVHASVVVVLVAIPFCAGVAAASGAGLQAGFVTAIVGGLVVGPLGGARLQVSGPAVSLAALVLPLMQLHGLAGVGAAVVLAGLLQMAAGLAGAGGLGRRVPASVVAGAVCAAGLAQALSQLTFVTGHAASPHAAANFFGLPHALAGARWDYAWPGAVTLAVALGWHRMPFAWARLIPGPLAGVVVATLACLGMPNAAPHLHLTAFLPTLGGAGLIDALRDPGVVAAGCLIAIVALRRVAGVGGSHGLGGKRTHHAQTQP